MARYGAIAAVGESVVRFLKGAFVDFPGGVPVVEQVTTRSFQSAAGTETNFHTATGSVTLFLYRVDIDAIQRNPILRTQTPTGSETRRVYALPLDLRYLVTAWAAQPDVQQLILGRVLSALAGHATFGPADLVDTIGGAVDIWDPDESVQLVPDEMGTEDLYQIWEAIGRPFELSIPYKARVIRIEADPFEGGDFVRERHLIHGPAIPDRSDQ